LSPIKGLVGQEMTLEDYLQHIKQEALAAPRRSSARSSRKVRQPSLWAEELDLLLHRRLSQALASYSGKWREHAVSSQARTTGKAEEICSQDIPCS